MAINPIDILLLIVIALSLLNGYRRGFVHGVLDLAGWVLSLIAGLRYLPAGRALAWSTRRLMVGGLGPADCFCDRRADRGRRLFT